MTESLGKKFLKVALIYFAITITVGMIFSIRTIHSIIILSEYMAEFHAHLSLIGWVSMSILGLMYCYLEDKNIPYDESTGFKGFLFIVVGAILMPTLLLITGIINIFASGGNYPIIELVVISAVILMFGAYLSIYNIYKALK